MGQRGPPKKPSAIRRAEGNRGRLKMNDNEPEPTGLATMPAELSEDAKVVWLEVSGELERIGVLTSVDSRAFASYCESVADYWKAVLELRNSSDGLLKDGRKNPLCTLVHESFGRMMKAGSEFGMTPASRTNIAAKGLAAKEPSLEEFVGNKPKLRVAES